MKSPAQLHSCNEFRSTISWYWKRLRNVPIIEIPYRIGHLAKRFIDKLRYRQPMLTEDITTKLCLHTLDINPLIVEFPSFRNEVEVSADSIRRHEFDIFGNSSFFGKTINWHLDPKTGQSWPKLFWGDINFRDGTTVGGIKFAWEINRLHHLPRLALAANITGKDEYSDEIFNQLDNWLRENPYPFGINWISGIELGIRIVNIVYALKLLNRPLSKNENATVCQFITKHSQHLIRYPSKYSSCANHALSEALGLFAAGVTFPGLDPDGRWRKFGASVLEREITRQIMEDGSSFEHSFPYLQFVVDHFLVYFLLCREHGITCSEMIRVRLEQALTFIASLIDSGGNYPMIGDDDSGYLLKFEPVTENNFLSLLNTGRILFNLKYSTAPPLNPDVKTLLLLGREACRTGPDIFEQRREEGSSSHFHAKSGLSVIRNRECGELLFVGNSGPLGLEPLAGHGHADALSFWLSVDGNPIFVDPGTYLYHSGGMWRQYFRSTKAHNTICIDGLSQATSISDFMFDDFYRVHDGGIGQHKNGVIWSASHDGYRRLADPVTHGRRMLISSCGKTITIWDTLDCAGPHFVESYFHLHPSCKVTHAECEFIISSSKVVITLKPENAWDEMRLVYADTEDLCGWYSAEFDKLQGTNTIRLGKNIVGNTTLVTVINIDRQIRPDKEIRQ